MHHLLSYPLSPLSPVVDQSWVLRFILSSLIPMKLFSSVAIVFLLINVGCWLSVVTDRVNYWTHPLLEYLILLAMSEYNYTVLVLILFLV